MTLSRRNDDRIRDLCALAVASNKSKEELDQVLAELRSALHEYLLKLENKAAAAAVMGFQDLPKDRRHK